MGRKKIEIKPLTDERNRNVTFLKRKAGLMKKAYELSVLCGVSVNILIFNSNGKPYEFSSGDFDAEVDRYNDYEGTIERRRGAEFEAMALAGEDSDDDEKPGTGSKPSKSLKGKESFKARRGMPMGMGGPSGTAHGVGGMGVNGALNMNGKRARERDDSFVGGIFDEERTPPPPRPDSPSAGLNYALGLHNQPPPPPQNQQPPNWYRQPTPYHLGGGGPPFLPMPSQGWDNSMVTTYAWLQIQQAHQEQKRHLLEKQQQQLMELTSRSGGAAFLRDMLGAGLASGGGGAPAANTEFVWPTAPEASERDRESQDEGLIWALAGAGGPSREKRR